MMYPDVMVLSSCWFCRSELLYPAFPSFCPSCIAITADASPYLDVKGSSGDQTNYTEAALSELQAKLPIA
jgi:hypothetical protein